MFLRSPRIELDILDNNRTPGKEEDDYINDSLEKLKKMFNIVEKSKEKSRLQNQRIHSRKAQLLQWRACSYFQSCKKSW